MKGLQNAFAFCTFIYAPSTCSLFRSSVALLDSNKPFGSWDLNAHVLVWPNAGRLIEAEFALFNSIVDIMGFRGLFLKTSSYESR